MMEIVERILKAEGLVLLERDDCSHEAVAIEMFVGDPPLEGDVVRKIKDGYEVDAEQTRKRRAEMMRRTEALFEE